MDDLNKNIGHRQRLKDRLLQSGLEGFLDYEIVELLLTLGTPRKDCKPIAKAAISNFGSLTNVLSASIEELQQVDGIGPSNAFAILLFHELLIRYTKESIKDSALLDSPESVYAYLKAKIGNSKKENFVILYLDTKNKLIVDEISVGTLNASLVHPREVFQKAILYNSSHIIVAHNHPSGDHTPSNDDILTTRRLVEAGKILGITVADHIVVSVNGYTSMKNVGLM
jgi:DNA repair protein RadC